ncbi:MAG TPA: NUDIX domain-containing protein [Candidatus Paceibacterota bacterium]|nr:NUDIX domain-containing protein [Candidatus Paceibacterota bacterium]
MTKRGWLSDKEYDAIYSRVPRVCVDVVVHAPTGVLLAYRTLAPHKNHWHLPGGRVRFGETLAQAAERLVLEETGYRTLVGPIIGAMEFNRERQRGRPRHTVSVVLSATPLRGEKAGVGIFPRVRFFKTMPQPTARPHADFLLKKKLIRR